MSDSPLPSTSRLVTPTATVLPPEAKDTSATERVGRLLALSMFGTAMILIIGLGLIGWWLVGKLPHDIQPVAAATADQPSVEIAPPPVDIEYHWLVCPPNDGVALYRDDRGRPDARLFHPLNPTTKIGKEWMKVSGLTPKRACTTGDDEDFELADASVVLTEDNRCVVGDRVNHEYTARWLCADDSGQFVSAQDLEGYLNTSWKPVTELDGVRAMCCPSDAVNGCQLKHVHGGKVASR